jgi:hypothetical protein
MSVTFTDSCPHLGPIIYQRRVLPGPLRRHGSGGHAPPQYGMVQRTDAQLRYVRIFASFPRHATCVYPLLPGSRQARPGVSAVLRPRMHAVPCMLRLLTYQQHQPVLPRGPRANGLGYARPHNLITPEPTRSAPRHAARDWPDTGCVVAGRWAMGQGQGAGALKKKNRRTLGAKKVPGMVRFFVRSFLSCF